MAKRKLDVIDDSDGVERLSCRSRHDSGCFSAQHSPKSTDGLDSSVPFNVTDDGRVRKWQNDVCQESYLNMLAQDAPERDIYSTAVYSTPEYYDDWNARLNEFCISSNNISGEKVNTDRSSTSGGDTNTGTYQDIIDPEADHTYETSVVEEHYSDVIVRSTDTSCQLSKDNFAFEIVKLLHGCHATQKFKVELTDDEGLIWSMADLMHYDGVKSVLLKDETILVSKIIVKAKKKAEQFAARNVSKKRSLAFCNNIIRGIALAELEEQLSTEKPANDVDKKARKKLLNKFSQCSRRDRSSGKKLEVKFLGDHKNLHKDSAYRDIDGYFHDRSIFVFNPEGFLNIFTSQQLKEKSHCFYQGEEEFFIIKNFKGFCRIDN